ncbi:MAG: pentapeptide repeat-containing protein, partial [Thermomicrobiales bacterium]
MDRERFDALARLLATKGSRRGALSAILGVALFGHDPDEGLAKPGKGKRKGHAKGRGKGHEKGKGQGHTERDEPAELELEEAAAPEPEDDGPDVQAEGQGGRGKSKGKRRGKGKGKGKGRGRGKDKGRDEKSRNQGAQAEAIPASCCGTLGCPTPTPGSNRQKCNYAGQILAGVSASGANMQQVDGRGTTFSTAANPSDWTGVNWYKACLQNSTWNGAILGGANFDQACLFDADLTGAKVNNSTNTDSAFFCRTTLWDGTVSNRDCNRGTACCPACDETHPCGNGQVCCNGRCRTGNCCTAGDCTDRQCQSKACQSNQCQYAPVVNGPGPLCTTRCCSGICCTGVSTCNAANQC